MDTIQKARQVILNAETSLRDLIAKALAEQRYSDVKEIAELADRIARLLQSSDIQLSVSTPTRPPSPEMQIFVAKKPRPVRYTVNRTNPLVRRPSGAKTGYPKFIRDEDKLVKVGWSKKNKSEYEHRVPRETILAFVRHLDEKVMEAKKFDIDGLFPIFDNSGGEIPGYQVYVIVAWLREAGVIEKIGRDGYVIRDKSVLRAELDEEWNGLQAKTA